LALLLSEASPDGVADVSCAVMHDLQPAEGETLDPIVGDWSVFQLRKGHRFSVDDVACAWRGSVAAPNATLLLDIGCGIGSAGLTALHLHPGAHLTAVEAQDISHALFSRSIRYNGLQDRVELHRGDLRDHIALPEGATFELITGTPPYMPVGKGVMSPNPQRAHARMELRGSIFDYCAAARRWLAPGGRFCFVMTAWDERTELAPAAHGLVVVERMDIIFREGREPHICTMVCARVEDVDEDTARHSFTLTVRDKDGEYTPEYQVMRTAMGKGGSGGQARRAGRGTAASDT
jgi:tRNA1Val (adenine37-N6)-methyltransferase